MTAATVLDIVTEHLKREGRRLAGRIKYVTQSDIDAGRFDHWDETPQVGDWYIVPRPVQGLSREGNLEPKMFHASNTQDTDS